MEGAVLDRGIHRITLWTAVILSLPFVIALVAFGGPLSWLVLAISLSAVAAYSVPGLRFKEKPLLDSITSSTHFVSPAVYGLALAGATFSPSIFAILAAFFFWGMASHAFGAVQDVLPDREGGIHSVATVMGATWTVRFAIALWAAAGLLMLFTPWPGPIAALFTLPYIATALPFRSVSDEASESANRGWKRFLWINYSVGFLVTMLFILFALERH
jgi:4-hydroxybenzoate polyprenyltransferase